jgi:hypothetical protein
MALEKIQSVDQIEVVKNGSVQVRTKTTIMEDGKQISDTLHRHVIAPGADYSGEDVRVQAICAATHTADVIAEYQAASAAQGV